MSYKMISPNSRIDWIPLAGLTTPATPKATELNAGTNLSAAIVTGYTLGALASDMDNSKSIADEGNVDTPTLGNYDGKLQFFRDAVGTGTSQAPVPATVFTTARNVFKIAKVEGWLVSRHGKKQVVAYTPAVAALAAPVLTLGTTATTGGTLPAGATYWKLTAINANGETVGSNEVTATLTGSTSSQPFTWPAITGSTGFKLYRGTVAGAEGTLVATLGLVTSYTDTGAAGTAATVPAANTTSSISDVVSVFHFISDQPMDIDQEGGKPILFEVVFLPQGEMYLNVNVT